jgi:hypothetical protein
MCVCFTNLSVALRSTDDFHEQTHLHSSNLVGRGSFSFVRDKVDAFNHIHRLQAARQNDPTAQRQTPPSCKSKAGGHHKRASIAGGLEGSLEAFLHDVEHEEEVDTAAEFLDESPAYSILIKILSSFLQLNSMAVRVVCLLALATKT